MTGAVFDIACNTGFGPYDLHLSYAHDLRSCADRCAIWNLDRSLVPCRGATLGFGTFGPSGEIGGSECWLKWDMAGPGDKINTSIHSMILRSEYWTNEVSPFYDRTANITDQRTQ